MNGAAPSRSAGRTADVPPLVPRLRRRPDLAGALIHDTISTRALISTATAP